MVCCWTAKIHNLELGVPSWSEETWIPSWVPLHWRMIKKTWKHVAMHLSVYQAKCFMCGCTMNMYVHIYIYLWHIIDWMIFPWKIVMFHSCLYVYQRVNHMSPYYTISTISSYQNETIYYPPIVNINDIHIMLPAIYQPFPHIIPYIIILFLDIQYISIYYTLWLLNIAMERSTIFKFGKPSISIRAIYTIANC